MDIEDKSGLLSYQESKQKLIRAVELVSERTFDEELEHLSAINAEKLIADTFRVDFLKGINTSEVDQRRKEFGSNDIAARFQFSKSKCEAFCDTLRNNSIALLVIAVSLAALILQLVMNDAHRAVAWVESGFVLILILLAVLWYVLQAITKEENASQIITESFRQLVSVIRDSGEICEIYDTQLVPGDVILIKEGDNIPVDGFVLEAHGLQVDESSMTGETEPVKKNTLSECLMARDEIIQNGKRDGAGPHALPSPILLSGTKILSGSGRYVAIVVGAEPSMGKIRETLELPPPAMTPLQEQVDSFVRKMRGRGIISGFLTFLILLVRFFVEGSKNDGLQWTEFAHYLMIAAIIVMITAMTDGSRLILPLAVATAAKKMRNEKKLVRKLNACETLGRVDTILVDKTGALTMNHMQVTGFWNETFKEFKSNHYNNLVENVTKSYSSKHVSAITQQHWFPKLDPKLISRYLNTQIE